MIGTYMRNYEQQSSKCLKQTVHGTLPSKYGFKVWSNRLVKRTTSELPVNENRRRNIYILNMILYDDLYVLGWLQTSNQFNFFSYTDPGKKHIFCFPVRWPDLSGSVRSVLIAPMIDPAGGSSVGCIQWGVSWWVQGPPNLQICWWWRAIWSEPRWSQDEANMKPRVALVLPWFWRVERKRTLNFQVPSQRYTVCSLQSSVKSLTVDGYLCSPRHAKSSGTDSQTPSRPGYFAPFTLHHQYFDGRKNVVSE